MNANLLMLRKTIKRKKKKKNILAVKKCKAVTPSQRAAVVD